MMCSCYCLPSLDLIAFPQSYESAPTFTASCFCIPPFSCTYSQVFFWDKVLFISRMHHRWLDLYFVRKTKMTQKTKDCLPVVITLFNIARRSELKDKNFCQRRNAGHGLLYKTRQKKTYSSRTSMVIYCETVIFF